MAVPIKLTVFAPGMKVPPLFVQFPSMLIFAPAVKVPDVSVSREARVLLIFRVAGAVKFPVVSVRLAVVSVAVLPPVLSVCPAVRLTTTLLNICAAAVPLICWEAVPTNFTVFAPGVNAPPLFVQFPVMFTVVPAVKVPAFKVSVAVEEPLMFKVAGSVKLPAV